MNKALICELYDFGSRHVKNIWKNNLIEQTVVPKNGKKNNVFMPFKLSVI